MKLGDEKRSLFHIISPTYLSYGHLAAPLCLSFYICYIRTAQWIYRGQGDSVLLTQQDSFIICIHCVGLSKISLNGPFL
jgi:hypothetical protein